MRNIMFVLVIVLMLISLLSLVALSQEKEKKNTKYFEVYKEVGKGKDLNEAKEDAYQNAIIEFLRKNVSLKDIKDNSQKLLKELFSSNKIRYFIENDKVISQEYSGDSQKIIVDIVLRVDRILEVLQKLNIPLKETSKFYNSEIYIDSTNSVDN